MERPKSKKKVSVTRPFQQHGYIPVDENVTEEYGKCPFCGREAHKHEYTFYINKKSFEWQCKSCGREGGFQKFLQQMSDHCIKHFKGPHAAKLSKDRGLSLTTLRLFKIGFNPYTKKFVIPVLDAMGEKIWDLRMFDGKSLMSTASCKLGLFNWNSFNTEVNDIYLCEGEWDSLALLELQNNLNFEGTIVGLPGAGALKADWVSLFKDKTVYALYDNDEAGEKGSLRCFKSLKQIVTVLKFLHWGKKGEFPERYDIRDYYKENGSKTLTFILDNLHDTPPGAKDLPTLNVGGGAVNNSLFQGPGLPFQEVYDGYSKWLKIKDLNILDVMFGTVLANRIPGNPVWTFLMGPPGAMKTELLLSLDRTPRNITTSTLTAPSLISGSNSAGGSDPSLFAILNKRMLVVKDFTTIMGMNPLVAQEVIGYFRDAYDGKVEKRFGNGIFRSYQPCFFGMLAGVTNAIEPFTDSHTALGERFIRYCVEIPSSKQDKLDILEKAMSNTSHENQMQEELRKIALQCLDHDFKSIPIVKEEIKTKVKNLSLWTADMRVAVSRDPYTKVVLYKPEPELPTRIAKQFTRLILGMSQFRGIDEATETQYSIIKKVAKDTVPSRHEEVIRTMYALDPFGDYNSLLLKDSVGLPTITLDYILEDLKMVKMLEVPRGQKSKRNYVLSDYAHDLIECADLYKKPEKKNPKNIIPLRRKLL